MNLLALEGGLYEIISRVEDEELLMKLRNIVKEVIEQSASTSDFWDELSAEQQTTLEKALEGSQQDENLVAHQVILDKYQQWQKK